MAITKKKHLFSPLDQYLLCIILKQEKSIVYNLVEHSNPWYIDVH